MTGYGQNLCGEDDVLDPEEGGTPENKAAPEPEKKTEEAAVPEKQPIPEQDITGRPDFTPVPESIFDQETDEPKKQEEPETKAEEPAPEPENDPEPAAEEPAAEPVNEPVQTAQDDGKLDSIIAQNELLKAQNYELQKQTESLRSQLSDISDNMMLVLKNLTEVGKMASAHEQIEANLNKELQKYKDDFYDQLAAPFLNQLISIHNEMQSEKESCESKNDESLKDTIDCLTYYIQKVESSIINSGVEIRKPEVGDKFNHIEQIIVKAIACDDPEKKEIIESVRSATYIYHGKVLKPARVTVYKVN